MSGAVGRGRGRSWGRGRALQEAPAPGVPRRSWGRGRALQEAPAPGVPLRSWGRGRAVQEAPAPGVPPQQRQEGGPQVGRGRSRGKSRGASPAQQAPGSRPQAPSLQPSLPQAKLSSVTSTPVAEMGKMAITEKKEGDRQPTSKNDEGPTFVARQQWSSNEGAAGQDSIMLADHIIARLHNEFEQFSTYEGGIPNITTDIKLDIVDGDLSHMQGEIMGPTDTPYENEKYLLEIRIPQSYPFTPPKVKFITNIVHPNVDAITGDINMPLLKKEWAPLVTVRNLLVCIQALLAHPEERQLESNDDEKLLQLIEMGFDVETSHSALSTHSWNLERAVESLFGS